MTYIYFAKLKINVSLAQHTFSQIPKMFTAPPVSPRPEGDVTKGRSDWINQLWLKYFTFIKNMTLWTHC